MKEFKRGTQVVVFRCPSDGTWPGGAYSKKERWFLNKTVLTFQNVKPNKLDAYVTQGTSGTYSIPLDCLRLAKRKPTIII